MIYVTNKRRTASVLYICMSIYMYALYVLGDRLSWLVGGVSQYSIRFPEGVQGCFPLNFDSGSYRVNPLTIKNIKNGYLPTVITHYMWCVGRNI